MPRKSKGLSPEDQELWGRVAQSTRPLHARVLPVPQPDPPKAPALAPGHAAVPAPVRPGQVLRPSPPPRPPVLDMTPSLGEAPVVMDKRQFQRMTRGKLDPEARIDLHGMTLDQAHGALNRFILGAQARGLRLVLVITGKGKTTRDDGPIPRRPGALKQDVPRWLRMAPLGQAVLELREAHLRHGGAGALYVYLRRMK
jgi:DNA-nicking Smr family endonuclease